MATLDCTPALPFSPGARTRPRVPVHGPRAAADPRWYPFPHRPWPLAADCDARDLDLAVALDVPVVIDAETPLAAHALARRIHDHGERRGGPWITYSPTGDDRADAAAGLTAGFARADGGTLFVDDLGALSAVEQDTLSRLLDDVEDAPAGDDRPRGVRLLAAARPGLAGRVAVGGFSDRLYYRINLIRLACGPRHQIHTSPARD